jgi:hypothetical protein
MTISGEPVLLDGKGYGKTRSSAPTAPGYRFFLGPGPSRDSESVFYYPEDYSLVRILLPRLDQGTRRRSRIVIKASVDSTWAASKTYELRPDVAGDRTALSFVCKEGDWDLAILVDGYAPMFEKTRAPLPFSELPVSGMKRAARLRARILDSRSGRAPSSWAAFVARVGYDPESQESIFFKTLPIASDTTELDYHCLPVGGWDLEVTARDSGSRRAVVSALEPGGVVNLGDLFVSGSGSLGLTVSFPKEVPTDNLTISLYRPPEPGDEQPPALLAVRTVTPATTVRLEFSDLSPGLLRVEAESIGGLLKRSMDVSIAAATLTEAAFVFIPIRIRGVVKRGSEAVVGAKVEANVEGDKFPPVESGEVGEFAVVIWKQARMVALMTSPPDEEFPLAELVKISEDAELVEHDVMLPANYVFGTVRDAESGATLDEVQLLFRSTATPGPRAEDDFRFSLRRNSDSQGNFKLGNLRPKPLDIRATKEGYSPREIQAVMPTEQGTSVDIELARGVGIRGVVLDADGAPVAGAKVGLDFAPGGYMFGSSVVTDGSGEFEFRHVTRGPHKLWGMKCGHTLVVRTIHTGGDDGVDSSSADQRETLVLPEDSSSIRVRFEGSDGNPIARTSARWVINGEPVPIEEWGALAVSCGLSPLSGGDGHLTLSGFPQGVISAISVVDQAPLGTFQNDGATNVWTIKVPQGVH